jgi:hypothetical protein
VRRPGALLAGAGALALLTGCSSASEPDVSAVATSFEDQAGDAQARCDLLAPATLTTFESDRSVPCADAIGDLPLAGGEVTSVEVWGGDAQVRLGGDTVFLTETDAGWRVTAAGCEPHGEAPYECEVEGP